MTKRIGRLVSFCAALLLAGTASLYAHGPDKRSMDSMCEGHHAEAMKASDEVKTHLAEAKRSGTLAEMRNHVEQADKAMAEMGKHMSLCVGMMEKMHGGMTSGEKKAAGKATVLAVYKPRGMTPYGWRKQREQRTVSEPR